MEHKNSISSLTLMIAALSLIATVYGLLPGQGVSYVFPSMHGQDVSIYGRGLYQNDSVSVAAQAIGQDIVTLILGIPLLLIALQLARKGRIKGKLLLTGMLGYFLYTYASYSFLSMYNSFFLVDVVLMSLSFFAFTLSMMSFGNENLCKHFPERFPATIIGGLLIFIACILGLMWLKLILTPLMLGGVPTQLEHYTTLTIQALDLGFVVPTAILSGILLIKRKAFGYLLSTVITIKETALLIAITAMIATQAISGVSVSVATVALFGMFDVVIIGCFITMLKYIKED